MTASVEATATEHVSFIQGEMRSFAMALHTKDQAPKEGKAKEGAPPVKTWQPTIDGYLQFLVDSRHVYTTLEEIVGSREELACLHDTGLERSAALDIDIEWLSQQRDPSNPPVSIPAVGDAGKNYAELLRRTADESLPRFICHFYNHYFAHTAGGRMIGGMMAKELLDGKKLEFYRWERGNVKQLLADVATSIDGLTEDWTREEKDACLQETASAFQNGGALLGYLKV
eukprot:CAMPEP_0185776436 /NCGR_PEP_ID=MMETSP1174-20130828/85667_1 /TAXON_ID=35687 /ORGANISM="Dictyocha speculum, Strain CCMP1381" /LENGTH=227 /DNA_ID=CAMNT_0028464389 /DNA_START=225 /DNA_END=908 /DNA_ORIENTATION=+